MEKRITGPSLGPRKARRVATAGVGRRPEKPKFEEEATAENYPNSGEEKRCKVQHRPESRYNEKSMCVPLGFARTEEEVAKIPVLNWEGKWTYGLQRGLRAYLLGRGGDKRSEKNVQRVRRLIEN